MFKREYHQKILTVLNQLNADLLAECQAYLGGGTLVSFNCGEHRLCRSLTFRCHKGQKYGLLYGIVYESGYHALFTKFDDITLPRDIQFHHHSFQFPVVVTGTPIKLQVMIENQFRLAPPTFPSWSPVACLERVDCIADKLLASSERWNKLSAKSRELIDLAALRLVAPFPEAAWQQAEEVFPVSKYLQQAIKQFQQQPDYRARCYQALDLSKN